MSSSNKHDTNCPCTRCFTRSMRCATKGCEGQKLPGSDFCPSCLTARRSRPSTRATCNNMMTIHDPDRI
jgi:hypothetical protein